MSGMESDNLDSPELVYLKGLLNWRKGQNWKTEDADLGRDPKLEVRVLRVFMKHVYMKRVFTSVYETFVYETFVYERLFVKRVFINHPCC